MDCTALAATELCLDWNRRIVIALNQRLVVPSINDRRAAPGISDDVQIVCVQMQITHRSL